MDDYVKFRAHDTNPFHVYTSVDDPRFRKVTEDKAYDVIVVGSGMGGGALVRQLLTKGKKVLLIEKGTIKFPTHVLNMSRTHFDHKGTTGRGRDNEVMFDRVKVPYTVDLASKTTRKYAGGAINAVGGRSLFWSLETPLIERKAAETYFPAGIVKDLWGTEKGQEPGLQSQLTRAVRVMTNTPPNDMHLPGGVNIKDGTVAEDVAALKTAIKDYDGGAVKPVQVGAEFASKLDPYYYFPQGAYSTTDYLLDRALNRDPNLVILLDNEVRHVTFDTVGGTNNVHTLNFHKEEESELAVGKAKVVLAAGTIDTPAIALRSNLGKYMDKNGDRIGVGLTDHEIWTAKSSKLTDHAKSQPLELATTVQIKSKDGKDIHPALLTVCTKAEKFFSHGFADGKGKIRRILILDEKSRVLLDPLKKIDPRLLINYTPMNKDIQDHVQKLVEEIFTAFHITDKPTAKLEGFGTVAHETGTMRVDGPHPEKQRGVVDENLKVHGIGNLFVCDLSVFPFSPAPNPSLTLTALALRLGDHL